MVWSARMRRSQIIRATLTTIARPMKNQRCQPDACARMLKAAPVFSRDTMSRIGSSAMLSCSFTVLITSALVAWSTITTRNDSHSQLLPPRVGVNQTFAKGLVICSPSRKAAHFARTFHIGHATATQLWVARVVSHIFTLVPAAHALGRGRRLHHDPHRVRLALFSRSRIGRTIACRVHA